MCSVCFNLNMKETYFSEALVPTHQTTRCHNPDNKSMNFHCHETLKSHDEVVDQPRNSYFLKDC